jgi:carbon starvation protein CstA
MRFVPSRLRGGEWIVAVSAAVLLVLMFVAAWYDPRVGGAGSLNGFHSLTGLRWLVLITLATAFALVFLQATRPGPALPVSFSVFVTVLGGLTSLWMVYRVLISSPLSGSLDTQTAASYIALASVLALTYGGFRSMREEDKPDPARNEAIETVHLDGTA